MSTVTLEDTLMAIARACVDKGPGFAQEGVVLRKAQEELKPHSLADQRRILDAWQRLFIDGKLAWGHDLENPRDPFFHLPTDD